MHKVSVIVLNYNHSKYLQQRIESILNQTYTDFELIILDDNSTDNSKEIIDSYVKKHPEIKNFYNTKNTGNPCKQWDLGVSKASGKYLWIAESDDFADPEFLKEAVQILDENEKNGLVYCNVMVINEQTNSTYITSDKIKKIEKQKWRKEYSNNGREELHGFFYLNNRICNVSGVLFRKEIYIKAGLADYSMKYCGDWFLYCRILLISDIAYIDRPLNICRRHANSTFHDYFKIAYMREIIRIYLFLNSKIKLSVKMKLNMVKNILTIIIKQNFYRINRRAR